MIPNRIFVQGFLCYREPQEARFEGGILWMISGRNGSGKSALFDALTYVLYGRHRAGQRQARGLIHHDASALSVELDFTIDERDFRARRTLDRNGRCTRQIYEYTPAAEPGAPADGHPPGRWREIPDTHTKPGFAQWVSNHVAMTFEAFTSSVLLLQGHADTLLLAGAESRHALVQQLIGTDKLERLHKRIKMACTEMRGEVRLLTRQRKNAAPVTAAEIATLTSKQEKAANRRDQCAAEIARLATLLEQSLHWRALGDRQAQITKQIETGQRRLDIHQTEITTRQRHDFLQMSLPVLADYLGLIATLKEERSGIEQLTAQRHPLSTQSKQLSTRLIKWQRLLAFIDAKYKQVLLNLEEAAARRTVLAAALPGLERLAAAYATLQAHHQQFTADQGRIERLQRIRGRFTGGRIAASDLATCRANLHQARAEMAQSRQRATQLAERAGRLEQVSGSRKCPYCGQELTRTHVAAERNRLEHETHQIETQLAQQHGHIEAETVRLQAIESRHRVRTQRLEKIDRQLHDLTIANKLVQRVTAEAVAECNAAYESMPAAWRQRIAVRRPDDWRQSAGPDSEDVRICHEAATAMDRCIARASRWRDRLLARRERYVAHCASDRSSRDQLEHHLQELELRLATDTANVEAHSQAAMRLHTQLPAAWRAWTPEEAAQQQHRLDRQLQGLIRHVSQLGQEGTEDASYHLSELHRELAIIVEQLAAVPSAAQADSSDFQIALDSVRNEHSKTVRNERDLAAALAAAKALHTRDTATQQELAEAQRRLQRWERLSLLLGPKYLQHDISRYAEDTIVESANAILDRLATGSIRLETRRDDACNSTAERTLDLVALTRESPSTPIDLSFLSGSQRFRVAVALALALGQFASRTGRPVQAVIIDEGFGCLDRVNRQVMVQELNSLRACMKRILLVSHQEEFADAFAHGYRCEQIDGSARLREFHQ